MPLTFLGQPLRSATAWRIALVLAAVLGLHSCALYEVAAGLDTLKPEDTTQTTLTVALISPPPLPPEAAPTPAPTRPPRPRSQAAPSLPAPAPPPPLPPPREVEPEPPPSTPPPVVEPAPSPPVVEEPRLPPGVNDLPKTGRIAYRTTYTRMRGIRALTFVDWNVDPGRARYELWLRTVDPAGLLDLKSSGSLQAFGIAPEKYVERVEIANRELRAEFDWTSRVVSFAGRGAGQPAGFLEGVQDPLSLQFHLPLIAQAYPWRFSPGAEVTFQVGRRNVENYTFRVEAYEPVRIGEKDVQALKLERPRSPTASRRVEIWMAPEYQWLPIRLRFTDTNDEVWDSVLAALPGEEQPRDPAQEEVIKP
jgi:Protein of unknown function (DUF3108)